MKMSIIPEIISLGVSSYLEFVEWDVDKEKYISPMNKTLRPLKIQEINFMLEESSTPSMDELNFLMQAEQDLEILKQFKRVKNIIKNRSEDKQSNTF
jgi:hypothetical protein